MDIILSNTSGKPIYEQIAAQIKDQIITGALRAGEALPSMRLLAKELHISVITTKRAYEDLTRDGFLESIPGKGCFICDNEKQVEQEVHRWYTAFDEATASLIALGVSREQMVERIRRGGHKDA